MNNKILWIFVTIISLSIFVLFCIFKFIVVKSEKIKLNNNIKYQLKKSEKIDYENNFIKNINWNKSKEVNGLKLFIKPIKYIQENKIYTKEIFFSYPSFIETKEEKIIEKKRKETIKKIGLDHLLINIIIKNTSNIPILFCYCLDRNTGKDSNKNLDEGLYEVKNWFFLERLDSHFDLFPSPSYYDEPVTTENVVEILPGQMSIRNVFLGIYNFSKGNHTILYKYGFRSASVSLLPSINGKIVSSKEITLPVWEGELQSNALTVVVR